MGVFETRVFEGGGGSFVVVSSVARGVEYTEGTFSDLASHTEMGL